MKTKEFDLPAEPITKAPRKLCIWMPSFVYQVCLNDEKGECILKGEQESISFHPDPLASDEKKKLDEQFSEAVLDLAAKYMQELEALPVQNAPETNEATD